MNIGKLSSEMLQNTILGKLSPRRKEVLVRPSLGEDCSVIKNSQGAYVLSMDPITGASKNLGRLLVNVCCNDIASCGIEPIGIMVTILLPITAKEQDVIELIDELEDACKELNIEILGGHTEVTDGVNRTIVCGTIVGNGSVESIITSSGAKIGDKVIMTKSAAIEGTSIIAYEYENEITEKFGKEFVDKSKAYEAKLSVVKEGLIAAKYSPTAMHDITEGGVLGACWEIAEASGKGIIVDQKAIIIEEETKVLCDYFELDPLKLISSGSMLICIENPKPLMDQLRVEGIECSIVGEIIKEDILILRENEKEKLGQPERDELYKILK